MADRPAPVPARFTSPAIYDESDIEVEALGDAAPALAARRPQPCVLCGLFTDVRHGVCNRCADLWPDQGEREQL